MNYEFDSISLKHKCLVIKKKHEINNNDLNTIVTNAKEIKIYPSCCSLKDIVYSDKILALIINKLKIEENSNIKKTEKYSDIIKIFDEIDCSDITDKLVSYLMILNRKKNIDMIKLANLLVEIIINFDEWKEIKTIPINYNDSSIAYVPLIIENFIYENENIKNEDNNEDNCLPTIITENIKENTIKEELKPLFSHLVNKLDINDLAKILIKRYNKNNDIISFVKAVIKYVDNPSQKYSNRTYYKTYRSEKGFTYCEILDLCVKSYWSAVEDIFDNDPNYIKHLTLNGFHIDTNKNCIYPY